MTSNEQLILARDAVEILRAKGYGISAANMEAVLAERDALIAQRDELLAACRDLLADVIRAHPEWGWNPGREELADVIRARKAIDRAEGREG